LKHDDEIVFVDPLDSQSHHPICLIKLLMIVALRLGHVQGRTLHDVLKHTAKRHDKTIQWIRPSWPVLCKLQSGTFVQLPVQAPASNLQLNLATKQIALAAGVLGRVHAHATRYGAIRDAAYLKKTVIGVTSAAVTAIAKHSNLSAHRGQTRAYIGSLQDSHYNLRAESSYVDRLAPKIAATAVELPLYRSSREITSFMNERHMDTLDNNQRRAAAKILRKQDIEFWETQQRGGESICSNDVHDTTSAASLLKLPLPAFGKVVVFSHARNVTSGVSGEQDKSSERSPGLEIYKDGSPKYTRPALSEKGRSSVNISQGRLRKGGFGGEISPKQSGSQILGDGKDGEIDTYGNQTANIGAPLATSSIPIDPRLLELDNNLDDNDDEVDVDGLAALHSILFPRQEECLSDDTQDSAMKDTLAAALIDDMNLLPQDNFDPLSLNGDAYVAWFASINVYKYHKFVVKDEALISGNSRNPPQRFRFYCGVGTCQSHFHSPRELKVHQVSCKGVDRPGPNSKLATDLGTSSKIGTRAASWSGARSCWKCPNKPEVLYNTFKELLAHELQEHDHLAEPMHCPLKDDPKCSAKDKVYERRKPLQKHLGHIHLQRAEQIAILVPNKRKKVDLSCPIEGCGYPFRVISPNELRRHMKNKHSKSQEECLQLVPLTANELLTQSRTELMAACKTQAKRKRPSDSDLTCPVIRCGKGPFADFSSVRKHLRTKAVGHQMTESQAWALIPGEMGPQKKKKKTVKVFDDAFDNAVEKE
jgi:hypothetical protein